MGKTALEKQWEAQAAAELETVAQEEPLTQLDLIPLPQLDLAIREEALPQPERVPQNLKE